MIDVIIARALHVFAVVVWIGGMWMVTTVILPAVRRHDLGDDAVRAFEAVERRFVWQARAAVALVGLSGFYLIARLDLWEALRSGSYWWLCAMLGLWVLFVAILFVAEPLVLKSRFDSWAIRSPDRALVWLRRAHWLLLVLALITIFGAITGSQWWPTWG